MGPLDFAWHLINLFGVALLFALLVAVPAKLLWRAALQGWPWWRLAGVLALADAGVVLAGLVVFGRDGRMSTYALMVLASAAVLAWVGRRRLLS